MSTTTSTTRPRSPTSRGSRRSSSRLTFAFEFLFGGFFVAEGEQPEQSVGAGWELAMLLIGLVPDGVRGAQPRRRAGLDRRRPCSLAFALLAMDSDDPSLIGWPIVLIVLTAALGAYALQSRPAR